MATRRRAAAAHSTAVEAPRVIDWASPVQEEVFKYGPFPVVASGGFGSAKTWAFCLKALWLSDTFPKNRGVIARKVAKELEETTMQTFFKICPAAAYNNGGRRSDSEYSLRFNNGSEILWLHMDSEDIEGIIRGLEINWFLIDQAEEVSQELVEMMMTRLGRWDVTEVPEYLIAQQEGRWDFRNPVTGKPMPPTYAMLACNPDTELHWIYSMFHPDSPDYRRKMWPVINTTTGQPTGDFESYEDRGYKMFTMSSLDNKFLPEHTKRELLSKDKSFTRRFVFGLWGIPEGQIHAVDVASMVEGTQELLEWLLRTCRLSMSLDHGDASPTACAWWAVDQAGTCFCIGEYYMPNRLISYHREQITALTKDVFQGVYGMKLADPSIFFKTQQKHGGMWAISDEYEDCVNLPRATALFWQPADNNEMGTRNRINEYLQVDPERINPITKEKGSPRLFFLKESAGYPYGCNHILRQLRNQRRLKVGTEQGRPIFSDERDETIPDHGYDLVRYFIASRPAVASRAVEARSRRSFEAVRQEMLRFKAKGGFKMLADRARREMSVN